MSLQNNLRSENDLSDEELELLEEARKVVIDAWDQLELLRRALNNSRVESMYQIKRSTALGPTCPYYIKAVKLFKRDQLKEIKAAIGEINKALESIDE